jgi:hypothetical protein
MAFHFFHIVFHTSASPQTGKRCISYDESKAKKLRSSLGSVRGWLCYREQKRVITAMPLLQLLNVLRNTCCSGAQLLCAGYAENLYKRVGVNNLNFIDMKKYLLGLSAIVFAVVLFAFTAPAKQAKAANVEDELYWYRIDASGNIGSALNSGTQATKTDVLSESGCPDETGDDCARGYDEPQTFGVPAPGVSGNDRHIMKDEL